MHPKVGEERGGRVGKGVEGAARLGEEQAAGIMAFGPGLANEVLTGARGWESLVAKRPNGPAQHHAQPLTQW
jgi:hypothetical protein